MEDPWPLVILLTQRSQLRVRVSGGETFAEPWKAEDVDELETSSIRHIDFMQSFMDVLCHATGSLLGLTRWLGSARCYHLDSPSSSLSFELDETERFIRTGRLRLPRGTVTATYSAWKASSLRVDLFGEEESSDMNVALLAIARDLRTTLDGPVAKLQFSSVTVTVLEEYFIRDSLLRDAPMRFESRDVMTQSLSRLPDFCMDLFLALPGKYPAARWHVVTPLAQLQLEDSPRNDKKRRLSA